MLIVMLLENVNGNDIYSDIIKYTRAVVATCCVVVSAVPSGPAQNRRKYVRALVLRRYALFFWRRRTVLNVWLLLSLVADVAPGSRSRCYSFMIEESIIDVVLREAQVWVRSSSRFSYDQDTTQPLYSHQTDPPSSSSRHPTRISQQFRRLQQWNWKSFNSQSIDFFFFSQSIDVELEIDQAGVVLLLSIFSEEKLPHNQKRTARADALARHNSQGERDSN